MADNYHVRRRLSSIAQHILPGSAPASGSAQSWPSMVPKKDPRKPKLAIVSTEWRQNSHSEHMGDCFMHGWGVGGVWHEPAVEIVSMYVDQASSGIDRDRATEFGFTLYDDIAEALCCGGDKLAVDAVLIIGECVRPSITIPPIPVLIHTSNLPSVPRFGLAPHAIAPVLDRHGNYPKNEHNQTMYPRYRFFKACTDCFKKVGRSVPIFSDKHLSWRFDWAQEMVALSKELDFPFMAGSSLPIAWRMPSVDMPYGAEVEEVMCCAYGGLDSYDFHALEVIQCMAERRAGGETGIQWVEAFQGADVWKLMRDCSSWDDGGWDLRLMESALTRSHTIQQPRQGDKKEGNPGGAFCKRFPSLEEIEELVENPIAFRFLYSDGLKGTMLLLNGLIGDFNFAARLKGRDELLSCQMYLDAGRAPNVPNNVQYSSILMTNAEKMFLTRKAGYPVERTLVTGGIVEAACQSLTYGKRVPTPHMASLTYTSPAESLFGGHQEFYHARRGDHAN